MQRENVLKELKILQLQCVKCKKQKLAYSMFFISANESKTHVCRQCLLTDEDIQKRISGHFVDYTTQYLRNVPTPHFQNAENCLKSVSIVRQSLGESIDKLHEAIRLFKDNIQDYCNEVQAACQGYLKKVNKYQTFNIDQWSNLQVINQQKYLTNIRQHQQSLKLVLGKIEELSFSVPDIKEIKRGPKRASETLSDYPITAMVCAKNRQYFGLADGRIVYFINKNGLNIKKQMKAHDSLIRSLGFDGQFRLFSGSDDCSIKAWDIRGQQLKELGIFGIVSTGGHSYHRNIVVIDNGKMLASTRGQYDQYRIRVWGLEEYTHLYCFEGHTNYLKSLISHGQDKLISASDDRTLKVWNYKTKQCLRTVHHSTKISNLLYHQDDQVFVMIDDENQVYILNDQFEIIGGWSVSKKIACSSIGKYLYLAVDRFIFIYNLSGEKVGVINTELQVKAHAIMQVGNYLFMINGTGTFYKFLIEMS